MSRRRFRRVGPWILVLTVLAIPAEGQKRPKNQDYILSTPNQTVEIPDAADKFSSAQRPCANYTWAAALETMLRTQGADLKQEDLVVKVDGGAKCLTAITDFVRRAREIAGHYALADGRRIAVSTEFTPGPPVHTDPILLRLKAGHPLALVWKGKVLLLYGLLYDMSIAPNGERIYFMRELFLVDPAVAPGASGRTLKFERGKDDAAEIDGMFTVTTAGRSVYELPKK